MEQRYRFAEDKDTIKAWYDEWGGYVASVDVQSARRLFSDDVLGFGTFMDFVEGIDALADNQWTSIWPTIKEFRFRTEVLRVSVSHDRSHAVGIVPWESTGFDAQGTPYDRPGRATAVLVRESLTTPWLGIHTHFSLFPKEVKLSFGTRQSAS